ncbi:interleukin-12 receptor subunit beta-2 [Clupea harengus]|uniref:Interleukin-12 receptor subunit beta-2 n=1 Tax=Clupea harengus TaxID=7950 RepID=A0A6P8G6P0_CLUHA|nr:interleukin-12 receptor subunit beta-2 [Clupea harengus]XP_031430945.1 interleukin-12 receptor subunit beta-2 [Clupea harengus]
MCYAKTNAFFFLLYAVVIRNANSNCTAIPSLGRFVQVGANFTIFCINQGSCKGPRTGIFRDTVEKQLHQTENDTTIRHEVQGIMVNRTYTCKCEPVVCGVDIIVGYPPEVPQNLTCEQNGEFGNVSCTCKIGKETGLWTTSEFRVRTASHNSTTDVPVIHSGVNLATFYPGSDTRFVVSVRAFNKLGHSAAGEIDFTLSHIVRPTPPILDKVVCSSRHCRLLITNAGSCHILQVQHRQVRDQDQDPGHWSTQLFNRTHSNHNWNISISLEPFASHHFRARLKIRPHTGLWSQWRSFNQSRTGEEAPLKLDIWYIEKSSGSYILLWKKQNQSEARGIILGYTVLAEDTKTKETRSWNVTNTTFTNFTTQLCCHWVINISAFNSRGYSPPATIAILQEKEQRPQKVSHVSRSDGSVALSWQKPATAAAEAVIGYLVEWLLVDRPYKELQWRRLSRDQLSINITGLQPHECYKGAVYTLFKYGKGKAEFDISTQPKVPEKGPDVIRNLPLVNEDNTVEVSWMPVPRHQWRGCLRNYTLYVQGPEEKIAQYVVKTMRRKFRVSGLTPGQQYKVSMTAWTDAGQSPQGQFRLFTNKSRKEASSLLFRVLVTGFTVMSSLLLLLCLCHNSSLRQRFLTCCHLLPDMIPDPANSKWAKEFSGEKIEMALTLYLNESSMSEGEPDTLEVQEISNEGLIPGAVVGLSRSSSSSLQQDVCLSYNLTSPTTYLKSFSQESDQTQVSQNTEVTVDYISTHGMLSGESDREEEEEQPCLDGPTFLPCPLFDPLVSFGGKLTLDSVKIDCSDFLDEPFFLHC